VRFAVVALFCWCLATAAGAETFAAKVIAVIDGDTLVVLHQNRKITVRLAGIDAPEQTQPFGPASRAALLALVLRKDVQVTTKTVDDYGRTVAIVHAGKINAGEEQVRRGLAWEYSRFHSDKALMALQTEAQRARAGLWTQANPQAPWDYRKHAAGAPAAQGPAAAGRDCGKKHYCSQMASCDEAKYYYTQCGHKKLDKDGDGVPCENLCNPQPRRMR
jgi:micrococcal nuclease